MTAEAHPVAWTPSARRALPGLPEKAAAAAESSHAQLAQNPRRVGKPLRYELEGLHSARRGEFRIIYRITDVVTVIAIDHGADAYRTR